MKSLLDLKESLPADVRIIAVSKTIPAKRIMEAYVAGQRLFGENKVQEMVEKAFSLPADIEWHLIGHLQSNKVKFISPFVTLIHSIDSLKLLKEIDRQAHKAGRVIDCLLQIHIAREKTKFGLNPEELPTILNPENLKLLKNVRVRGLMGMASNTSDQNQIRMEFRHLSQLYRDLKEEFKLDVLSMGMSSDFLTAIEEGSNMIRVGSLIFGERG